MPRIRCHYMGCVFLEERFCTASAVEFDPDMGCLTFSQVGIPLDEEEWVEDELEDEKWEDLGYEEEDDDDDLWLDEDDDD